MSAMKTMRKEYYSNLAIKEKLVFVFGDKLPTWYDAAIVIFSVATQTKSSKM